MLFSKSLCRWKVKWRWTAVSVPLPEESLALPFVDVVQWYLSVPGAKFNLHSRRERKRRREGKLFYIHVFPKVMLISRQIWADVSRWPHAPVPTATSHSHCLTFPAIRDHISKLWARLPPLHCFLSGIWLQRWWNGGTVWVFPEVKIHPEYWVCTHQSAQD